MRTFNFPLVNTFDEGDVLLKDGINGTKTILAADAIPSNSDLIAVRDSAGNFASPNVEGALAEVAQQDVTIKNSNTVAPLVSFQFDDAPLTDYTVIKPIFDAKNVPANICVITNDIKLSDAQLLEMQSDGWGIASHTHTHASLAELTDAQIDVELKTSKDILTSKGIHCDAIVYPFTSVDSSVKNIARKYYKCGITGERVANNVQPIDNFYLIRKHGLGEPALPTLAACKNLVDSAILDNSWLIFEMHSGYTAWTTDATLVTQLAELIDYIKAQSVEIVNIENGINKMGNIIDSGDADSSYLRISKNGLIKSNEIDLKQYLVVSITNIDITTSILSYPNGITEIVFNGTQIDGKGFPENIGGTLITHKTPSNLNVASNSVSIGYQLFLPYDTNRVYKRLWRQATSDWSVFARIDCDTVRQSKTLLTAINSFGNDQIPTDFSSGYITINQIDTDHAAAMPEAQAGTLITYNTGAVYGIGYAHQMYYLYGTRKVYMRSWNKAGYWRTWEQIATKFSKVSVTVDCGTVLAQATQTVEIDYAGVILKDNVVVNINTALPSGISVYSRASNNNKVAVSFVNSTSASVVLGSLEILASAFRY